MRFTRFFCFLVLLHFGLFAQDLNLDQHYQKPLEQCFRHLLINAEVGYVLYGEKPVCIQWIPREKNLIFYNRHEFDFSILNQLSKCLDVLSPTWRGNFIVVNGSSEIRFINRKAFLRSVQENLILFQHVLGVEVTPEKLLKEIMQPNQCLEALLHYESALMGIVLGYGTQNGLFNSRYEKLHRALSTSPLCRMEQDCLLRERSCRHTSETWSPSFGFASLEDEYKDLSDKSLLSTKQIERGYPNLPIFGCWDSAESKPILQRYADARKKIRSLLHSDHFFEDLCNDLQVEFHPSELSKLDFSFDEETILNILPLIYNRYCQDTELHDSQWHESFIHGLTQKGVLLPFREFCLLNDQVALAQEAFQRVRNLRQADTFFLTLQEREDLTSVIPGKVYYKLFEEGAGTEVVDEQSKVTLSYSLEQIPNRNPLFGCHQKIGLNDFLEGPTACMLGMKVGEIREVWIHPDFASCDPVPIGVHGKIQLLQIEKFSDVASLSKDPVEPVKVEVKVEESEELLQTRFNELKKTLAEAWGRAVGQMLGIGIDVEKVVRAFKIQKTGRNLSPEENSMLSSFYISLFEKQKAEENRRAQEQFAALPSSAACLKKNRLYVKCIEEGTGPVIEKTDKVRMRCILKDHLGTVVSQFSFVHDLENEIPAFQTALPGHRVGTKMSLYIHPEWGFEGSSDRWGNCFLSSDIEILPPS